ncbi:MAG: CapA family protein [Eubacterium sp.]|nr:CapA family protein [Eubacterium sp.]
MGKRKNKQEKKQNNRKRNIRNALIKSVLIVSLFLLGILSVCLMQIILADQKDTRPQTAFHPSASKHTPANDSPAESAAASQKEKPAEKPTKKPAENAAEHALKNTAKKPEPPKDTTLVFAGDVYLSDYVLAAYQQSGIQGILSKELRKELKQADVTMVNNEFPYSMRGTQALNKQFTFRVDPSYVRILSESGIDLVTLANNHVLDYGTDALLDTFHTLREAGISYAGTGNSLERAAKPIRKKANGHTFGFLAASRVFPTVSWNVENAQPGVFSAYDPSRLLAAVKDARAECDFLCVYVHWGIERSTTPEEYQVTLAHALIDAGADAVIGAHPHVLQGVEFYNGKPIFYSLGNFIFYQNIEQTAIAKVTLTDQQDAQWQMLPAKASLSCTSLVTDPAARGDFYNYMEDLSKNVTFLEDGTIIDKNPQPD